MKTDCVENQKGTIDMKKVLPYALIPIAGLVGYGVNEGTKDSTNDNKAKIEQPIIAATDGDIGQDKNGIVKSEQITEAAIDCPKPAPKVKEIIKWKTRDVIKWKTVEKPTVVYQDRIVEKLVMPNEVGCYLDHKKNRVYAVGDSATHVTCMTNWRTKTTRTIMRKVDSDIQYLD